MNQPNITNLDCALPGVNPAENTCNGTDGGGTGPAKCVELVIQPDPAIVNAGGTWTYTATLKMSDGSFRDVTSDAQWESSLANVATVDAGVVTGIDAGISTITATFCNVQAFSQITVIAVCENSSMELTLCLGRDGGMTLTESGTQRIDIIRQGAAQLAGSLRANDKLALVSWAGKLFREVGQPNNYAPESTIESYLTSDKTALNAALLNYVVRGPCNPTPTLSTCAPVLYGGLQTALSVANGNGHTVSNKRAVVVVLDSFVNVNVDQWADAIKDADILLIIMCIGSNTSANNALLRGWASPGYFYQFPDATTCAASIASMSSLLCSYGYTQELDDDSVFVTPDIWSDTISYFGKGKNYPPGNYRVAYINGAIKYDGMFGWQINRAGDDHEYKIVHDDGATQVDAPCDSVEYKTQSLCEIANAGAFVDFVHTGGKIGVFLQDDPYWDNHSGSPSPTFQLLDNV